MNSLVIEVMANRIRISSICVELIFGKGHLSTLGVSRPLKKTPRVETFGRKNNQKTCVSRRSQSRKMTLSKDRLRLVSLSSELNQPLVCKTKCSVKRGGHN